MSPFHSRTIHITTTNGRVGDWLQALGVNRHAVVLPQDVKVSAFTVTLILFRVDSKGKRRLYTSVVHLTVDPSDYGI